MVVSGRPDHVGEAAVHRRHQPAAQPLHRVAARLVERLAGGHVALDVGVAVVGHPHPARHRGRLLPRRRARRPSLDDRQAGDHLVLAPAELAEHPGRVGRIPRLAEQAAVQHHLGVGAQDDRRPGGRRRGRRRPPGPWRARRRRWPAAGGTGGCSSGMWLARTSNGMPSCPSSSRRRGEAEARMRTGRAQVDDQGVLVGDDAVVLLDRLAEELGQAEAVQVRVAVPVAEVLGIQALGDEAVDLGRRTASGGRCPWRPG